MTQPTCSSRRWRRRRTAMLVASPLEVWDVTKVWTLIAKCIAEARVVEDLFVQPGGRRELATVLATFENAWRG